MFGAINFDQGQIGLGIAAHDCGVEFTLVLEDDLDFVGPFHDVVVGDDVAVPVNDKPGAQTGLAAGLGAWNTELGTEEIAELIVHVAALTLERMHGGLDGFFYLNVDHGRTDLVGQGTEILGCHAYPGIAGGRHGGRQTGRTDKAQQGQNHN